MDVERQSEVGAFLRDGGGVRFRVWAPRAAKVSLRLFKDHDVLEAAMVPEGKGYFGGFVPNASPGDKYAYLLHGGLLRPDPASRFQPDGVHGPSMIVDPGNFTWSDGPWTGISLSDYVIYELHVGTFTEIGTFEGVIAHLDYLSDLGITAVELMPVCQFAGKRNWGYDGVYPYAPHNFYGGPDRLKHLIDTCHRKGLAVVLDVVYNHLGPEGNYLADFGPYFTDRYKTPWGAAVNFDGPYSDEVRRYFIDNACYWVRDFHVDALRLDAVHGIFDFGARHILLELTEKVHGLAKNLGRLVYVIAESDLNDARVITPITLGGYAVDSQWNDDFHHSLHALLTAERQGYYGDFGEIDHMIKAMREGFVYSGQYSEYRKRSHGNSSRRRAGRQFVHFSQNHDQVGNRPQGDRLSRLLSPEKLKLAAAVVLLCPGIPLLFMGEEYGETAPFLYFVDHSDQSLIESVRLGRAAGYPGTDRGLEIPNPADERTFLSSKIDLDLRRQSKHREVFAFYKEVLRLRRSVAILGKPVRRSLSVRKFDHGRVLAVRRALQGEALVALFNFADLDCKIRGILGSGRWSRILDSSSSLWGGPGERAPSDVEDEGSEVSLSSWNAVLYRNVSLRVS